jgi:hypothetical protein
VEEFRVPLMKGIIQPPKEHVVNARELSLDLFVNYLSGGGAGDLPVKLRTLTQPHYVGFEDFEGYTFANGEIKEEVTRRGRQRTYWEDEEEGYDSEEEREPQKERSGARPRARPDRRSGRVSGPAEAHASQDLVAEMEFRDPNGGEDRELARPALAVKGARGYQARLLARVQGRLQVLPAVADVAGKPVRNRKVSPSSSSA